MKLSTNSRYRAIVISENVLIFAIVPSGNGKTFDRLKHKRTKGVWLAEIISKQYRDNFK